MVDLDLELEDELLEDGVLLKVIVLVTVAGLLFTLNDTIIYSSFRKAFNCILDIAAYLGFSCLSFLFHFFSSIKITLTYTISLEYIFLPKIQIPISYISNYENCNNRSTDRAIRDAHLR